MQIDSYTKHVQPSNTSGSADFSVGFFRLDPLDQPSLPWKSQRHFVTSFFLPQRCPPGLDLDLQILGMQKVAFMEKLPYTWKCLFVRTTNLRKPAYVNQKSSAPHSFRSCNSYTGPQATEIDHPHHPGPKTAISLCTWGLQKGAWEQSAVDDGATKKHGEVEHICVKLLGF